MSIQFSCEQCGHPIDVDDRFAGLAGHCKHCGHTMTIPAASPETTAPIGLRLRPVEGVDTPTTLESHHAPAPALQVRPLAADDPAPTTVHPPAADQRPIEVLDPDHLLKHAKATRLNPHYETRMARWLARLLRDTRDRLYLISLALLVTTLIGFLFKITPLLHLGTVGVVATNIIMLADSVAYLLVLPFRDSLAKGLGALLVPPYTIYYWIKHWDRMHKPLLSTIRSFTPILLAGLAYFFHQESPVIWDKVEQADRVVERALGVEPGPAAPRPRRPSVADQAKQVLGNEANIIEEMAKPQ